ncbi:MAG: tetratricopeptide repeat protein [Rhodospirillales bacterium]|nr:tetratricopeptide repeat protein [Rhodospirillales bacterium]
MAVAKHQAGHLAEAEALYKQVLRAEPRHPDALHLLGVVAQQTGRAEKAVELISKAIRVRPDFTQAYSNLGNAQKDLGRLDDAVGSYRRAIELKPDLAQAHFNLGTTLHELADLEGAVASYQAAIAFKPDYVHAYGNMANVLKQLEQFDVARTAYEAAIRISPGYAEAHNNLGQLHSAQGRYDEAINCYDRATALDPAYAEALANKGVALDKQGRYADAIRHYQLALAIKADFAFALNNQGNAERALGRFDEAEASYRRAHAVAPNAAKLQSNLGDLLIDQRRTEDALVCYRAAIELEPAYTSVRVNLAAALSTQGRIGEAISHMDQALVQAPENAGWHVRDALFMPIVVGSEQELAHYRDRLQKRVANLRAGNLRLSDPYREVGQANFRLSYDNANNCQLMQEIADMYLHLCPGLAFTADHCKPGENQPNPARQKRLRIGFVSAFLHRHTIGKLNAGIIAGFSRSDFEVIVVRAPGPSDAMSAEIDQSADAVIRLVGQLPVDRQTIADEAFDILFYLDIGMSPYTYFLSFARLAPVQAVTWGHPDTTGVKTMDYFISSRLVEPEDAAGHYCETLVQLNFLPTSYRQPEPLATVVARSEFGLPDQGHLYVCPQTLFKFHPRFDALIKRLLEQDPDGYLVLIADPSPQPWRQLLAARFKATLGDVEDRIIFLAGMAEQKYLRLLSVCDVMIDIPTFSGGNSIFEAFAMGTPVVTWPGSFMRGRGTASCYRQMGMDDLIVDSEAAYLKTALKLATDPWFRQQMQDKIRAGLPRIFAQTDVIREMEDFFKAAHAAWRNGVPYSPPGPLS